MKLKIDLSGDEVQMLINAVAEKHSMLVHGERILTNNAELLHAKLETLLTVARYEEENGA